MMLWWLRIIAHRQLPVARLMLLQCASHQEQCSEIDALQSKYKYKYKYNYKYKYKHKYKYRYSDAHSSASHQHGNANRCLLYLYLYVEIHCTTVTAAMGRDLDALYILQYSIVHAPDCTYSRFNPALVQCSPAVYLQCVSISNSENTWFLLLLLLLLLCDWKRHMLWC